MSSDFWQLVSRLVHNDTIRELNVDWEHGLTYDWRSWDDPAQQITTKSYFSWFSDVTTAAAAAVDCLEILRFETEAFDLRVYQGNRVGTQENPFDAQCSGRCVWSADYMTLMSGTQWSVKTASVVSVNLHWTARPVFSRIIGCERSKTR